MNTDSDAPFKGTHIKEIDTFRAAAMISVLLFHYIKEFYPGTASFLLFGWTGVDIFFIISGFVLYLQFRRKYLKDSHIEYGLYFRNRFMRIAPAFYASLLAEVVLFHPGQLLSKSFIAHLTFTHMVSYDIAYSIQPVYWILAVEVQFYLVIIFCGRMFSERKGYAGLLVVFLLSLFYRYAVSLKFGYSHTGILLINHLPGRLPEFCCGIAMAKLYRDRGLWGRLTGSVVNISAILVAGMIIYVPLAGLWLSGRDEIFNDTLISTVFHPLIGLSYSLIMLALMGLPERIRFLVRLRPVVFIGLMSYSIYLWHMFVIEFLNKYLHLKDMVLRAGLKMAIAVIITLAVSTVSYYLIEKTFLRFRKV